MANTNDIVDAVLKEDLFTAKKIIHETLLKKLGNALEEKLVDFAPTVFNEGSKPDFLDIDGDGNKEEPMKKAAKDKKKKKKKKTNEEIDVGDAITNDDEMQEIVENFEQELAQLVEEIQIETGETLSEEEIAEVANELIDILSEEESMEETDEEENEDDMEESDDDIETNLPAENRTIGGVDY